VTSLPLGDAWAHADAQVLAHRLALGIDPFDVRLAMAERLGILGDPRLPPIGPPARVEVPEGPFLLGADETDDAAPQKGHEYPQVTLDLPAFEIDRFLVTVAQFARFVDDGGYHREDLWRPQGFQWRNEQKLERPRFQEPDERAQWEIYLTPNRPIVGVSFYEAEAYARWAGGRLPTEAEWEKAARGPDGQEYPWGDEWIDDAAGGREIGPRTTLPVGVFPKGESTYGALDVVGSVWQWCADVYDASLYQRIDEDHPRGGDEGPVDVHRCVRGGAWNTLRYSLRCANRNSYKATARYSNLGFRVVFT
jgi:formylglycine-generating enzyme required for sulfatase activity